MAKFPKQRVEKLIVSETADDVVVYDQQSHEVHTLNMTAFTVWNACTGSASSVQIAVDLCLTQEVVEDALSKLSDAMLLQTAYASGRTGETRRRFLRNAVVGSGVATAAIVSITAPTAASIPSCGPLVPSGEQCSPLKNCCEFVGAFQMTCQWAFGSTYTCQM